MFGLCLAGVKRAGAGLSRGRWLDAVAGRWKAGMPGEVVTSAETAAKERVEHRVPLTDSIASVRFGAFSRTYPD
jgi:hypothetical protein